MTSWTAACQAILSSTLSWSLLKLMSDESVILYSHLILCCPLLLLPSIFPTSEPFAVSQLFTSCGQSTGASASASVFPMNTQSGFPLGLTGLIFLLSKRLLQHHNLKISILWHSGFFVIQLSNPYTTTGKTMALTRWTFVGKVMSLVFIGHNFSSEEQASFNFMAAVAICSDFGAPKIKSVTVSTVFREIKGS